MTPAFRRLVVPVLAMLLLPLLLAAQGPEKGKDPPAKGAAADKVDFKKQILPIFEKRCFECHRSAHADENGKLRKPKGGVTLDSKEGITKSKKGKLVVPKKPGESKLVAAISLPADDEDRMPPAKKGDPLPKDQIELLTKWVEQGADFGDWTGKEKGKDGPAKDGPGKKEPGKEEPGKAPGKGKEGGGGEDEELAALAASVPPLAAPARARLEALHARVEALTADGPLVRLSFYGHEDEVGDATVAALLAAKEQIAELDLARTRITDAAGAQLAQLQHLRALDLRQTAIGDEGVRALAALPHLGTLNLFGTKVADQGLAALGGCEELRELYVWQTPCSAASAVALQHRRPALRIVFGADLPEPAERARGRRRG